MNSIENHRLTIAVRWLQGACLGVPLLFVLAAGAVKYPEYWVYFVQEISPISWLHSTMLFLVALFALGLVILRYIQRQSVQALFWSGWFLAFIYLMLDERFALHERMRDQFLSPLQIKIPLFFWTTPGDFILLLIFCFSIIFILLFLKYVPLTRTQIRWLAITFCVTGIAILLDSMPFKYYAQCIEEILETISISMFQVFLIEVIYADS